ncbi:MAG: HD domain-containing protein [Firmicutes bacterium]|nr:HD domain-containing protein [Bacillota bacterium]
MKKYVAADIYDNNGLLLVAKGMEISEKKVSKLKQFGLEEEIIEKTISEKKVTASNPTVKKPTKSGLNNTMDMFMASMNLLNKKVKGTDLEDFNYCNELLIDLLFGQEENWRIHLIGLANYADWVYTHSINVAILSLMIGKALGYKEEDLRILGVSAFLHDVGYLLIPKSLILGSSQFDAKDGYIVQQHCDLGKALLDEIPIEKVCKDVVLQHHERLDGSGYPNGLKTDDINPCAKIVMIADSFDAMTSERPYGEAVSQEMAVKMLQNDVEKYDRNLISIFTDILNPPHFRFV